MNARQLLVEIHAHMPPLAALKQLESADAERRLRDAPHSIAEIVAHMAFWQEWFLRRCEGTVAAMPAPASVGWPAVTPGSWPDVQARFTQGLERAVALEPDANRLVTPPIEFPPLAGYTVRDALVHMALHNSHHLGQVILLRQMMRQWPPPSGAWTW